MASQEYYRGGASFDLKPGDVRIDQTTGLLKTTHGVSVSDRPDGLERFGGAYKVSNVPVGLKIIQRGKPHHFEIAPARPMPISEYEDLLGQIMLVAV